ncbi:lysophospholipid acyltransferase family protein [Sulfurirhabdus autotrophica]|uniref:1-acyl-sn-glycerol-3-phosphate acyltransferase n=1 Tax=Sulfurirhabdus autotrophica TaxID=1706046 RepID=A0A4R3Y305_9PROT|nr:lysophospholipid acyltransferase family protein [Sulfurirhabdus autotrophica]TCV84704.1 1-acyl-sn-glycerol-3-phosphate acyltransferase [Sulfurirhabdus autotrophica]
MIWLRSLIYALCVFVITPVYSIISILTFPFHPITRYRIISYWARLNLFLVRVICGLKYKIIGAENIPDTPTIVLSKHQSAWETMAFQLIFPPLVWVLKRELLRIPFFGWGLAMTSPIAIDRAAGKEALKQIVDQGKQRLALGFWVVVFPEGTRVKPGEKGKYGIGGAWLATHTGAPVLPVAHNAGEYWGKNAFLRYPGTITVSIGKVIDTTRIKTSELNQQVEEWIESEMVRIGSRTEE